MGVQFGSGKWQLKAERERQRGLTERHETTGDKLLVALGTEVFDLGKTLGTEYFKWKVGGGEEANLIEKGKLDVLETEAGVKSAEQKAKEKLQSGQLDMARSIAGLDPVQGAIPAAAAPAAAAYTFPEEGVTPSAETPTAVGAPLAKLIAEGETPEGVPAAKPEPAPGKSDTEIRFDADGTFSFKMGGRVYPNYPDMKSALLAKQKAELAQARSGPNQAAINAAQRQRELVERRGDSLARKANLKNFKENEKERKALSTKVPNAANRKKMAALETEARGMLDGDALPLGTKFRRFKTRTADSLIKNYFSRRSNPSERAFAVRAAIAGSTNDDLKEFIRVNYGDVTSSNVEEIMMALIHTAQSAPKQTERKGADVLLSSISAQAKGHDIGADDAEKEVIEDIND